jgi:hypothetical protein
MNKIQPGFTDSARREYATKMVLSLVFAAAVALFYFLSGQARLLEIMRSWSVFDFVLLSLATYRLGHLVAYDRVMEPFRSPFARTVPDSTGAGESVEAKGEGVRHTIGQLITCPICAGTWIAAGLVFALAWLPELTRIFLWMTAAIGLAELINSISEMLCWSGQLSRVRVGESNRLHRAQAESAEQKQGRVQD